MSDNFLDVIFGAILKSAQEPPSLVRQWQQRTGCFDRDGIVELDRSDAVQLMNVLKQLPPFEDELTRACVTAIACFLSQHLEQHQPLYVEYE